MGPKLEILNIIFDYFEHCVYTSLTSAAKNPHCQWYTEWASTHSPLNSSHKSLYFPSTVVNKRHNIATGTCFPDTLGIRVQTPALQMACNFADTQLRRSGYKLCIMCPEGEEPVRRWRASLSAVTLGVLQWTMSHQPQLWKSAWLVLSVHQA